VDEVSHADAAAAQPRPAHWDFDEGDEIAPGRSVVSHLGGGTRFDVYLVWDEGLFSLGVAKVLRPDRLEDEGARRRLEREARLVRRLGHPVLVRGFASDLEGPYPHILLEHLDGPTLRALITDFGRLELEQLIPLVIDVSAALHYLSSQGVVHLDVKPANIVMGAPPRLIDMSMARSLDRAARVTRPLGTDAYMPPEQCDPAAWAGRIGTPADVWGLGASLYHAATGTVPFPRPRGAGDSDDPAIRFPQLFEEPAPPGGLPEPLAELILEMLQKEPEARPTPADVVHALEPLIGSPPRKTRLRKRFRRPGW
jgi:eukaryotic-like serine/threonine-protein kinase